MTLLFSKIIIFHSPWSDYFQNTISIGNVFTLKRNTLLRIVQPVYYWTIIYLNHTINFDALINALFNTIAVYCRIPFSLSPSYKRRESSVDRCVSNAICCAGQIFDSLKYHQYHHFHYHFSILCFMTLSIKVLRCCVKVTN